MPYKRSGEITIFLSLTMSVLFLLVTAVLMDVQRYSIKNDITIATECALVSCFGEYNEYLFRRYNLKYIDSSYKGEYPDSDNIADHFNIYFHENLSDEKKGYEIEETDIITFKTAKDDDYGNLLEQIRNNVTEAYGDIDNNYLDNTEILNNYIELHFGNYENAIEGSIRIGEWEYLLYRKESDEENILCARRDYEICLQESTDEYLSGEYIEYKDYLRERINELMYESKIEGICELIEENLKYNNSPGFDFGNCVYYIELKATIVDVMGEEYSIERRYGYR